jgi:hypothetical protein
MIFQISFEDSFFLEGGGGGVSKIGSQRELDFWRELCGSVFAITMSSGLIIFEVIPGL